MKKAGNAGAAGADALGQRALRVEFELEFAGEILLGEKLVLADIGRDHLPDLPRFQQHAEADAVDAGIVGDDGQILDAEVRTASISDSGMPQRPKPPAMIVMPSFSVSAQRIRASGVELVDLRCAFLVRPGPEIPKLARCRNAEASRRRGRAAQARTAMTKKRGNVKHAPIGAGRIGGRHASFIIREKGIPLGHIAQQRETGRRPEPCIHSTIASAPVSAW